MKGFYMKNIVYIPLLLVFAIGTMTFAQSVRRDNGTFVVPKNEFMDSIKKTLDSYNRKDEPVKKAFKLDFSSIKAPAAPSDFTQYWHNPPVSQAMTNTCWCFSTTSYLETEVYRLTKRKIKLSEMYTVYWEYVEKTRRFIRERGNSAFAEGSEANAVTRIWKMYGIIPEDAFTGLQPGHVFHDHSIMYNEMKTYLQFITEMNVIIEQSG